MSDIKQHLLPRGILAAFLFCFLSVAPMKGILPAVFSHHRGMKLAPETHSCQLLTHSPNQKVLEEQVLWTGDECYLAVVLVRFQGLGLQMDITHTRIDIYCPPTCSHMCADKQKHVHTLQRRSRPNTHFNLWITLMHALTMTSLSLFPLSPWKTTQICNAEEMFERHKKLERWKFLNTGSVQQTGKRIMGIITSEIVAELVRFSAYDMTGSFAVGLSTYSS